MRKLALKMMFFLIWTPLCFIHGQSFKGIPNELNNVIETSISTKNPLIIGEYFLGKPYQANSLSASNPEKIYYSFNDFDCVTYVENVLALYFSKGLADQFSNNLIKIRYNDSISYENRNHYLTVGLEKMVQLQFISPINNKLNSKVIQKNIHFLSKFSVNKNVDLLKLIHIEKSISHKNLYYFDKSNLKFTDNLIKNGDVIAFVSSRNDLDFTHVGFVYIKNHKKYIIHASQEKKRVCISDLPIDKYLIKNSKIKGFQIYRPAKQNVEIQF